MTIIDTFPIAERTITSIEASLISNVEYEELKNISKRIINYINKTYTNGFKSYNFIKLYLESIIINSERTYTIPRVYKEIIIGNIMLPNDIEIVELLTKNGYTIEHLKTIIRFRSLLKNIILNSVPFDQELERQFEIYKKHVDKIIELFKSALNIQEQTIILNRITEIVQTNPNYFESKNFEHTKKR